jgi:hypothetical protein
MALARPRGYGVLRSLVILGVALLALRAPTTPPRALADNGITAMNQGSYVDGSNELHLVGEIKNSGSQPVQDVNIAASFVDSSGKTFDGTQGYAEIRLLQPGDVVPYDVTKFPAPNAMVSYNLHMTWSKPDHAEAAGLVLQNDAPFDDGQGFIHITGTVANNGPQPAAGVRAVAVFYNSDGTVAFISDNLTSPSSLNPGDTANFELQPRSRPYSNYEVIVGARQGS